MKKMSILEHIEKWDREECYIMTVDMDFGFVPGDPVCFDKLSRWD